MGFVINNNLAANNSYRSLNATQTDLSKSLEKLSTGLRINRAGDDAAGLSISEGLKSQVTGSAQAARNAQDGISVIQTAEGALTEVHSILQRVRDLAVQAGNDTNNADARTAIKTEADRSGRRAGPHRDVHQLQRHQAARPAALPARQADASRSAPAAPLPTTRSSVDLDQLADIVTLVVHRGQRRCTLRHVPTNARQQPIATIDTAASRPSPLSVPDLGAAQNRLEHTIKSLNVAGENLQAAQSRIADVDMAQEMVKFTKANILSQAGTAMLAQANQSSQGVLSLLR